MAVHRLAGADIVDADRRPLAQPSGDDVESLRTGVEWMGVSAPGGPLPSLTRSRYSGAAIEGTGRSQPLWCRRRRSTPRPEREQPRLSRNFGDQRRRSLVAYGIRAPNIRAGGGLRLISDGKFSIRQYNGPVGSCLTFISVTGLTTYSSSAPPALTVPTS